MADFNQRFFTRVGVKCDCALYINELDNIEVSCGISDISEDGIGFVITDEDILSKIQMGMTFSFQSVDVFNYYIDKKIAYIMGSAKVVRIAGNNIGCRLIQMNKELEEYIAQKKAAAYMEVRKALEF